MFRRRRWIGALLKVPQGGCLAEPGCAVSRRACEARKGSRAKPLRSQRTRQGFLRRSDSLRLCVAGVASLREKTSPAELAKFAEDSCERFLRTKGSKTKRPLAQRSHAKIFRAITVRCICARKILFLATPQRAQRKETRAEFAEVSCQKSSAPLQSSAPLRERLLSCLRELTPRSCLLLPGRTAWL